MKRVLIGFLFLSFGYHLHSQSKDAKWVVGLSAAMVNFGDKGPSSVGDRFLFQLPKINVSRYIYKGITLDASLSLSTLNRIEGFFSNNFSYFSVDGTARYDFNKSYENFVPYVGLGLSIVGGPSTVPGSKASPTTNLVVGTTFWIHPQFAINAQAIAKNSSSSIDSMRSHSQVSVGVVYSLEPRNLVQRLWTRNRR